MSNGKTGDKSSIPAKAVVEAPVSCNDILTSTARHLIKIVEAGNYVRSSAKSAADIAAVCTARRMPALESHVRCGFLSTSAPLLTGFRRYRAFVSDRSGELPVPPDAGGIGLRATLM